MEYRKYIFRRTKEEWALVYETKVHGLFYNPKTKEIKRFKGNEYKHVVNMLGKYNRTKLEVTIDAITLEESPLSHLNGFMCRTLKNDSSTTKYDDFEVLHYYKNNFDIPMVYGRYRISNNGKYSSSDEIANMTADKLKDYTLLTNLSLLDEL